MVDKINTPAPQKPAYPEMRAPSTMATLSATQPVRMATGLAAGAGDALRGMADAVSHPIDTARRIGSEISGNYAENSKNLGPAAGAAATMAQGAAAFTMRPVAEAARAMMSGKYQIAGREAVGLGLGAAGKLNKFAKLGRAGAADDAAGLAAKAEGAAGSAAKIEGSRAAAGAEGAAAAATKAAAEKASPLSPNRISATGNQGDSFVRTQTSSVNLAEHKLGEMHKELDQLLAKKQTFGDANTPTKQARLAKLDQDIAAQRQKIDGQSQVLGERKAALASTVEDVIAARVIRNASSRTVQLTENALIKEAKGAESTASRGQVTEYLADIYADLSKKLEAGERARFPAASQSMGPEAVARHTQNAGAMIERELREMSPNLPLRKLFPEGKIDQAAFSKRLAERMSDAGASSTPATDMLKQFRTF